MDKNKKNILWNILLVIMIIIFECISYYKLVITASNLDNVYKYLFIALIIGIDIGIILFKLILKKKEKLELHRVFLIIGFFIGLVYMVAIPMMKGTDEIPHFFRIYRISQGEIVVTNNSKTYIPVNVEKYGDPSDLSFYSKSTIFEKDSEELMLLEDNRSADSRTILQYIPQVIGIKVMQILKVGPFFTFYFVRLCTLVFYLMMCYYAIKIIPVKKEFMFILSLSPAMLSLMSTMSGDVVYISGAFLFISLLVRLIYEKKKITNLEMVLIIILGMILSIFKSNVLFPLVFLTLLFSDESFKGRKINKKQFALITIILSFISLYFWRNITGWLNGPVTENTIEIINDNPTVLQEMFIKDNLFRYFIIFINYITNNISYLLVNLVSGGEMVLACADINEFLSYSYFALLILSFFYDNRTVKINNILKVVIVLIFCCIVGGTVTHEYIGWSSIRKGIGTLEIAGFQSRYMVPFIPLLMLLIPNLKNKIKLSNKVLYYSCFILSGLILLETIGSLIAHYFVLL